MSTADQPVPGDVVTVALRLFRADGAPVASSSLEEPWRFRVGDGSMVEGIDALVRTMTVGETRRAGLPAEKAWGARGVTGLVAPGEDLRVEVDLVEVRRG